MDIDAGKRASDMRSRCQTWAALDDISQSSEIYWNEVGFLRYKSGHA
ncbi:hypothetical protein SAR116_0384 [Candidatus Puniceispirillum marinum IMCC1322]|uniref:Uncharacterized protein n=1 Tax=Puniceispirillum marinum (strain IMCC1322) TaxID=488538 RepID=D5BQR3_PUNMI|nr:hypothetical protein SAR116_0384 [Candidatus Puniceispirillum marinum IMCC1322]